MNLRCGRRGEVCAVHRWHRERCLILSRADGPHAILSRRHERYNYHVPGCKRKIYFQEIQEIVAYQSKRVDFCERCRVSRFRPGITAKWPKCIPNFKLNKRCHFFMYVIQMEKIQSVFGFRLQGQKECVDSKSAVSTYTRTHMLVFSRC